MKKALKNFSFPFTTPVMAFSAVMIFLPIILIGILGPEKFVKTDPKLIKTVLLISSLTASIGFIYCILGFHLKLTRGDELRLRIHLESLNAAFAGTLIIFFILIFAFINFFPSMLNWILVFLSIAGLIIYQLAFLIIKNRYR